MVKHALNTSPRRIAEGVFVVGRPDLSDPRDCLCYLVLGSEVRVLMLIATAGPAPALRAYWIWPCKRPPPSHLLITHAQIDHAGGAAELTRLCGCQVLIHQADAQTLA
ncbi:hypothetical protein DFAR_1240007 [Desulfarculales bacterium]